MEICRTAEGEKTLESIWFISFIAQMEKLRPQMGHRTSSMSHGELGAKPGWTPRTPDCSLGLFPLCYMVSWVERSTERIRNIKKEKVGCRQTRQTSKLSMKRRMGRKQCPRFQFCSSLPLPGGTACLSMEGSLVQRSPQTLGGPRAKPGHFIPAPKTHTQGL